MQNVNLGNWDTSNVTNMYGLVKSCAKLQTIDMRSATFTQITSAENYQDIFLHVPVGATIIVKQDQKDWIQNTAKFPGTITTI